MRQLLLRPAAAAEVEEAWRWYEEQRPGFGEQFLDAFASQLERVAESPEMYPVVHRDTRRALLKRFPYGVFYRVVGKQVVVVACFHAKRDPRRWRERR